jgi:hypothetical protein
MATQDTYPTHAHIPNIKRYDPPTAGDNLGRTIGDPRPASLDGRPHGFTVGHAVGDPRPASLDGRPHGFTVGHAVGAPRPASLDGRPHGFTVGHAIDARSTTPDDLRPPTRAPGDRPNRTRDPRPAPAKRAA